MHWAETQYMPNSEELDEALRLAALHRVGLLDTAPEERFDRLTRLTATALDVPIALVSLVDEHRQWFKSKQGLAASQTPREQAFCAVAIKGHEDFFVVEDASADPRFRENPLVVDAPNIRFYAGRVLRDSEGFALGTLCAIDRCPRRFDDSMRRALDDLALLTEAEINRQSMETVLQRLEESERRKTLILEALSEGLMLHDSTGTIASWNPAVERLLGVTSDEMRSLTAAEWGQRTFTEEGVPWPVRNHPSLVALRTGEAVEGAILCVEHPERGRVVLEVSARPTYGPQDEVTGTITAFTDVTAQRQAKQLTHWSHHDMLTNLPNRRLLDVELAKAITDAGDPAVAVCFLDLDRFKVVNDTLGHAAGDALLVRVANSLRSVTRPGDLACRIGGDEFLLLLHDVASVDDAVSVAQRVLVELQRDLASEQRELGVSASVGVARWMAGESAADLIARADAALYRAKRTLSWSMEVCRGDRGAKRFAMATGQAHRDTATCA